jgi:hypothetical protein
VPVLVLLLIAEALTFRSMVRSPFTPWLLFAWPAGAWVTGWTLYSIWERLTTPTRSKSDRRMR